MAGWLGPDQGGSQGAAEASQPPGGQARRVDRDPSVPTCGVTHGLGRKRLPGWKPSCEGLTHWGQGPPEEGGWARVAVKAG